MQFSEAGQSELATLERFNECVKPCPAGYPTIGYGHRVWPGEQYNKPGYTMDRKEALELLRKDTEPTAAFLSNYLDVRLKQCQFDALVMFVYNIGRTAFLNSSVYRNIKDGNIDEALTFWGKWVNVTRTSIDMDTGEINKKLVLMDGLVNRRATEMKLFAS